MGMWVAGVGWGGGVWIFSSFNSICSCQLRVARKLDCAGTLNDKCGAHTSQGVHGASSEIVYVLMTVRSFRLVRLHSLRVYALISHYTLVR